MRSHAVDPRRWAVKKAGRLSCMTASFASGSLAVRERVGPTCVRVITYHRFGELLRDPFAVSPTMFDQQMAWLASEQRAISLADLGDFLRGERELQDGSVLVTIDDGFRSTLTEAAPILAAHGIPAVAFITSSLVGNQAAADEQPEHYLDWQEVAQLESAGVVIGSHNHTHRSLTKVPGDTAHEGALLSRHVLSEQLTGQIDAFAYPFGTRADYDSATGQVLRDAGYTFGFTSRHGTITADSDAVELPRIKVEGAENLRLFKWLCRGGMDAWRLVDDTLFRTQQRRQEQRV